MSVTSYILNFESKLSAEEFQAQIRVIFSEGIYGAGTMVKSGQFKDCRKSRLSEEDNRLFYFYGFANLTKHFVTISPADILSSSKDV